VTKIYAPGEKREHSETDEDKYIPNNVPRDMLALLFTRFVDEHLYDTKQFYKYFGDRRASHELIFDSLLDLIKNSVCYDPEDNIDVRILYQVIPPSDKKLFIDLVTQIGERFVNVKGKSPLTLYQFKVLLAYRMAQVGF
jgi:hypothetical protein